MSQEIAIDPDQIWLVCGQTDTGKSYLYRKFMYDFMIDGTDIFLYDIGGEAQRSRIGRELKKGSTIYVPKTDSVEEFENVVKQVWEHGNVMFGVEELDLFTAPRKIPPTLRTLCIRHRHRGIGFGWTTRFFSDVHKLPCRNAKHRFIFQLYLPQDIDYLAEFIPKEQALKARDLEDYHFLYNRRNQTTEIKPITPID